ncbi:rab-GTPase-TBC domain-containing protein [Rhodocollybia butyracea]|uniref:Rab-GTPase-TBC domain-containing protein n=1 Tax=Rhodocollybia butyracea TaxID=206335 RepID=A0A9P5UFF8_9AGAR|nr:rab-GTPase-TBC domain-containing protein [Rhodocollybia butyracea]
MASLYDATFWQHARAQSLKPGGFGKYRVKYWTKLLNVTADNEESTAQFATLPKHADERQIRLDTDRSFVMYPDGDVQDYQETLNELIVHIFRKHTSLSYFQGFHDIITVILLTLPPDLRFPCAEKVSLHMTRDAMGSGLEPVLGLLRFLSKLVGTADPQLAGLLKQAAPLPYFALSHLLTMFAHDVPTLPLIQHIFDYLLARPPIAVVYLAAAMMLERKDELLAFASDEDGDLGMLHSLLGALPRLSDDVEEPVAKSSSHPVETALDNEETVAGDGDESGSRALDNEESFSSSASDVTDSDTLADSEPYSESETETGSDNGDNLYTKRLPSIPSHSPSPSYSVTPTLSTTLEPSQTEVQPPPSHPTYSPTSSPTKLPLPPADTLNLSSPSPTLHSRDSSSSSSSSEPDTHDTLNSAKKRHIPLSTLLCAADTLLDTYPPYPEYPQSIRSPSSTSSVEPSTDTDTADLSSEPNDASQFQIQNTSLIPLLASTMGPLSVVYTWSEDPAGLPRDADAANMVHDTSQLVYPWDPSLDEDQAEDQPSSGEDKKVQRQRRSKLPLPLLLRRSEVVIGAGAGAVLVLAIALAVFGNRGTGGWRSERFPLERVLGFLGAWGALLGWG